jgi:predicted Fe-S protein YdhL (DUF1289 family)
LGSILSVALFSLFVARRFRFQRLVLLLDQGGEIAQREAKEIVILASDPDKEISGSVLEALEKVLPQILKGRYGITLSFWALQKLNEITDGDLSYEAVSRIVQYAKLSDDEKQAIHNLLTKLNRVTLAEIARYAKLSDESKEAVQALVVYSHEKKMSPTEAPRLPGLGAEASKKTLR